MLPKMFLNCFILIALFVGAKTARNIVSDVVDLKTIFFNDLEINLSYENPSNMKRFIDEKIDSFVDVLEKSHKSNQHSVSRRSLMSDDLGTLTKDNAGVFVLDGYDVFGTVPVAFPKDIELFEFNEKLYATAIESRLKEKRADHLVIFKNVNGEFIEIIREPIRNGIKIDTYTAIDTSLIVVAENTTERDSLTVYEFTKEETLLKVQNLDTDHSTDVVIWSMQRNIYMAIARRFNDEIDTKIYRWLGRHFDLIQQGIGGHKILPFAIRSVHFLAVIKNSADDFFVEIFKFDLDKEVFVSHQKLLTKVAVDVKFLCFKQTHEKDSFLLVANEYEIDESGNKNYETTSVIYKFVDDYFVPFQTFSLNGATQWLPVIGPNGEFLLLISCKFDGAKSYQYDGWRFVETETQYTEGVFGKGITSMNYLIYDQKPRIVVVNEFDDGTFGNVFTPNFKHQNPLNEFQEDMLNWCNGALSDIEKTHSRKTRSGPKKSSRFDTDTDELPFSEAIHFKNFTIDDSSTVDTDDSSESLETDTELEKLQIIKVEIDEQIQLFNDIKTNFENLNVIEGDIVAQEVVADDITFNALSSKTINAIGVVDILSKSINITTDVTITEPIAFDVIKTTSLLTEYINGHPFENLLQKNADFNLTNLEVDGNVILESTLDIGGTVNGIKMQDDHILIDQKPQTLKGSLIFENVDIEKVTVENINNMKVSEITLNDRSPVSHIKNLYVKNATLDGSLNKIDLATLEKFALKKHGDQTVSEEYTFDDVIVDDFKVDGDLSNVNVSNLIRTDYGSYEIPQDVYFDNITVNEMSVGKSLNQINIKNGKNDVLLLDAPYIQYISGPKRFQNVELMNPVDMRFKIKCKALEKMNPVITIDEELLIRADVVLEGNVTVEKLFAAVDIYDKNLERSLSKVEHLGIKITDTEIPTHFNFTQQINVDEIFVDKINGVDVHSWVVNGNEETQYVMGPKIFNGDVYISGQTNLVNVNNINVPELEINTLRIDGDQKIIGKHYFKELVAPRIVGKNVKLNNKQWKNVIMLNENQIIEGVTVVDSIKTDHIKTVTLTTPGKINGINFTEMFLDTVQIGNIHNKIGGSKQFVNLKVNDLIAESGTHVVSPPDVKKIVIGQPIKFPDHVEIENIYFTDYCNGLSRDNFGFDWVESYGNQIIDGEQIFSDLLVFGKVYVKSGYINGVDLSDLYWNTVKIDEDHYFNSATFYDNLISENEITLNGHIVGLDLDNIVTPGDDDEQIISDQIIFEEDVTIDGRLHFTGLVSQLNLTELCIFAQSDHLKRLIIDGNARFGFGPKLKYVNEYSVDEILQNAWFGDQRTEINENVQFADIIFENDITIDGHIDGVNLAHFYEAYFSKSRDQYVTANIYFTDDITFADGIFAPYAVLNGDINDINLEEFRNTAILNGVDQVFENTPILERCEILDLDGDFTVNGLNLETDVMRYDTDSIVIGAKRIKNLDVSNLLTKNDTKVQNVVLNDWIKRAVLKNGSFSIGGRKIFNKNVTFLKGIGSDYVNGKKFDDNTILLRHLEQNVTGRKTVEGSTPTISFEQVYLHGNFNGYNLDEVLNDHAKKNENLTFVSPVYFKNGLTANDVNFKETYYGINISDLIRNVSQLRKLNNYNRNYETLLNKTHKITDSLKSQAYYLHDYKVAQSFKGVKKIVPVLNGNVQHLLTVPEGDDYNYNVYFWNEHKKSFEVKTVLGDIFYSKHPTYVGTVDFDGQQIIYAEIADANYNNGFSHYGQFLSIENDAVILKLRPILTNGTKHLESFVEPMTNQTCFLFVYSKKINLSIYCPFLTDFVVKEPQVYAATTASVFYVKNVPFLIIVEKETNEASVGVWKYNSLLKQFEINQIISVTEPISIATTYYKNTHYLAIASGHVTNIIHQGLVDILRFDVTSEQFTSWQILRMNAPIQVRLSILPSDELVLYVLKEDESEPLLVYMYEGIAGFNLKITATALSKQTAIKTFDTYNRHFIIAENGAGTDIIKATFKGDRYL